MFGRVDGTHRDADAHADLDTVALYGEGSANIGNDPFGSPIRILGLPQVKAYDAKFVTAQSRDGIARPHQGRQPTRHLDEQLIPGGVAHGVIDRLETVEIKHEHRGQHVVLDRKLDSLLQCPFEHRTISEAGQGVV